MEGTDGFMSKFKVGDRVKVYGCIPTDGGFTFGVKGTVTKISPGGLGNPIAVDCGFSQGHIEVHPKQCRLLKKRERREWKLTRSIIGLEVDGPISLVIGETVHVREVRKK